MSERWINAVVEVVIPTDVALDAPHEEKVEAALAQLDRMVLPDDATASIWYELVEDGEPV